MSIRKDQYPNGLHIVFVVKPTNMACVNLFTLNPYVPIMVKLGISENIYFTVKEFNLKKRSPKSHYIEGFISKV